MKKLIPVSDRLMKKIQKTESCWIWTGCCNVHGYGKIGVPGRGQGITIATHRLSYELFKGKIPEGMNVCHKCDVPACCNPDHLFIGTQKENLQDMSRKGRSPNPDYKGTKHPQVKLTAEQVLEIRRLRKETNISLRALAQQFKISLGAICHILARRSWSHI